MSRPTYTKLALNVQLIVSGHYQYDFDKERYFFSEDVSKSSDNSNMVLVFEKNILFLIIFIPKFPHMLQKKLVVLYLFRLK